ncbi:helix-turn-helix transcriptional regulator [Flavobacterium ajazii]|uniref:helix-turn-helix transcriptional regulator n=1 Tax=Flavobacterium ajazii TaxID=2692318 RepID=UPI0013CF444E|nr:helix-turn-helix domain-containing protein [Flavobacterium ajazii]
MTAYTIKNNIKIIRELRNYTQDYMAEEMGITQAGYSKIEKGKTDLSLGKLEKIAHIFDCNIQDIISFDTKIYLKKVKDLKGKAEINFDNNNVLIKLYEDKVILLELLLNKTDSELKLYKNKFGTL